MKLRSLPRSLRTARPMRPRQIAAQLLHLAAPAAKPARVRGETPALRTHSSPAPFLPAPAHARVREDAIELIGRSLPTSPHLDWNAEGESALFAFHLHQFDWARSPELSPELRSGWLLDWIEKHPSGVGWKPHPISLRILSWGKLLLQPGALSLSDERAESVRRSLADQIETLDRQLEVRLQANHLLSNLLGVVFGGLLLDGPRCDRWLRRSDWLVREIEDQIGADGAHVERSPMYHSLLLENLLDLVNLAAGLAWCPIEPAIEPVRKACERMLGALAFWSHPDGEIALFGDSAFGIAHSPEQLFAYARSLGVSEPGRPDQLEDAGFLRLDASPFTLIASVAGPMPPHQPGHAHCDALSFELSVGEQRVITDTGVSEYVPGERRDAARSVRGHATLELGSAEQAELWAAHRVGGRPRVRLSHVDLPQSFEATCASYFCPDSLHRRRVAISSAELVIEDTLEGASQPACSRLPLAPGLEPRLVRAADGSTVAEIDLADGRMLRIELATTLEWRAEKAPYFPEFGRSVERICLVGEGPAFVRGVSRLSLRSASAASAL